MANKMIKGLTIQIGADTLGLDKALRGIESAGKKATSELREVKNSLKTAPDSAVLWKQKQELLNTALENSRKKLELLENAQSQVNEKFEKGEIGAEQYRAFQRETEYARAAVEKYENGLKDANTKVKELGNESSDAADDVKDLGDEASGTASGGISAMTVALGNLVADGIKKAGSELKDFTKDIVQTGMTFEASMSSVGAVSGASAAEMEMLREKAEEMGATTKFTAAESADAFQYMAMAGWKTSDMLDGISGVLDLAAASGEDLGTTSDIVTDALTAFGLTAKDTQHFVDVLAAASSNANTNVSMMGETFKYAAPIAGSLGFSIEDTAQAIGLMANSGIKASQAGTSLRTIMTSLSGDVKICGEQLGEVAIQTSNSDGSMRELNDILEDCRTAFSKLSESEQAAEAASLVGKEAMSGFLSLMNAAPEDIEKLSGAIEDCDSAAQGMADTMMNNLSGDVTLFNSAVDGMKISLSNKLNPALRDIVQYATQQIPKVEKTLEKVFDKSVDFVKFVIKNAPKAIDTAKKSIPIISGIGAAFLTWKAVDMIKKASASMKALNIVMSANPALAVATAVIGLTTALGSLYLANRDNVDELQIMVDKEKEYQEQIHNSNDELKKMIDNTNDSCQAEAAHWDSVNKLWKELETLADKDGNVSEKNRERAEYIMGELQDATGIEIKMVDGQIQKYEDLKESIEDVIKTKRAEALLAVYADKQGDFLMSKADTEQQIRELSAKIAPDQQNWDSFVNFYRNKGMSITGSESYDDLKKIALNSSMTKGEIEEFLDWAGRATTSKTMLEQYNLELEALQEGLTDAADGIQKYEDAQRALAEGRVDDIDDILLAEKDANRDILKDSKRTDYERERAFKDSVKAQSAVLQANIKTGKESAVKAALEGFETIEKDAKKSGTNTAYGYGNEFRTACSEALASGYDLTEMYDYFKEQGYNVGEIFGSEVMSGIYKQLNTKASAKIKPTTFNPINSPGDVALLESGKYEIRDGELVPKLAKGGTFSNGSAIVAEAGPELITLMNGRATVTPLTDSARNTALAGAGAETRAANVYQTFNIQASISSDYDVRRLSQQLAALSKKTAYGKGV